jgi:Ni/Co efflux regulator RcnB
MINKLILATLTAATLATPVLAEAHGPGHNDNRGRYEQRHDNRGPQYRAWHKGDRFDHRYARDYRVIARPADYRLRPAPRGYRWVRSGNDAVLIGITSGIVASVLVNTIR